MLKQVIFLNKVIQNEMPDYLSDSQYTRDVNCHNPKQKITNVIIATRLHFFGAKNISQNV